LGVFPIQRIVGDRGFGLLHVDVFVRDEVHQAVFEVGLQPVCAADGFDVVLLS